MVKLVKKSLTRDISNCYARAMTSEKKYKQLIGEQTQLIEQRKHAAKVLRDFNLMKELLAPETRIQGEVELTDRLGQLDRRLEEIDFELM
ncbi:hypothetical protein [Adhaeretor mobilis]|uniref:Uncharacterized protein n=1 Tax=Adhaeretor mobilis TaxID=1930276 RepID=A0A517MQ87_9BACT|nr:hypothetical protein [Adhaeretor mobilis]QDS97039.1 hypothetical protein HG15A2_02980 [Adhaeretor mobilis]